MSAPVTFHPPPRALADPTDDGHLVRRSWSLARRTVGPSAPSSTLPGDRWLDTATDLAGGGTSTLTDAAIVVRGGAPTTALGTTATRQVLSRADTAVGDYLLIVADVDYVAASGLTIQGTAGVGSGAPADWSLAVTADDSSTLVTKAWLGRVTSGGTGARTITVEQTSTSGIHVHCYTLNPDGGTITVDGALALVDRSSPFDHAGLTPAGTLDLLIAAHGQVQFSTTTAYGAAPSGMTGTATYVNANAGMQSCYQNLTSAAATGSRTQTSTPTTVSGGAGFLLLLRNRKTTGGSSAYRAMKVWDGASWLLVGDPRVGTLGKGDVGLAAVDNTADVDKPVSTAQQLAINTRPAGVIGSFRRTSNATATTATAATGATPILRLTVPGLLAGRLYRIRCDGIHLSGTASQVCGYQLTYTTATPGNTPATPTVTSTLIEQTYANTGPVASQSTQWFLVGLLAPAAAMTVTILLSYWRQSGSAACTCQGSAASPLDVVVEDLGPNVSSTGAAL